MNASEVSFRVTPEVLLAKSVSLGQHIRTLREAFHAAENVVGSMGSYWQGEAYQAYRAAYSAHGPEIEEILMRLQEHVVDLNEIAGNYQIAEQWAVEQAEALPDDVIV